MNRLLLMLAGLALAAFQAAAANVILKSPTATCEIAPEDGARIVSWKVDGAEMLWNPSVPARDGKWRHGGIPLVWPWAATDWPEGEVHSPHGIAWTRPFKVEARRTTAEADEVVLSLEACGLRGEYTIRLTDRLGLRFRTKNVGAAPRSFEMAYHPYLYLKDRDGTTIDGFDALRYRDTRDGFATNGVWKGAVAVNSWLDHVFYRSDAPVTAAVRDGTSGRRLRISSPEAAVYVVWNPGEQWTTEGTPEYGGLETGAYRHILSVEPSTLDRKLAPPLRPGEERVLTAEFLCHD